ncbi:hypothetical protein ACJMK2_027995 [Sinanodonta woodiana]|uniref:Uncharacterized protein n=1 Tax=Sinanodonta woodiana TaxID=1069815 RepID=A0ABD3X978_SINWO
METRKCRINGFLENGCSVLGQHVKSIGILMDTPTGESSSKKDGKKSHRVVFNVNGRKLRPGEGEEEILKPICPSCDINCWDVNKHESKEYVSLTVDDSFVKIKSMSVLRDVPQTGLADSTVANSNTRANDVAAPKRPNLKVNRSGLSEQFLPICPRSGFLAETNHNGSKTQRILNDLQTSTRSCCYVSSEAREETKHTRFQISEENNHVRVISRETRRNSTSNIEESEEIIPNEAEKTIHSCNNEEPKTLHESYIRSGPSKLCKQFLKSKFPTSTKQSVLIGDVINEVNAHDRKSVDDNKPERVDVKRPVTIGKIKTMRSGLWVGIR